MSKPTTMTASRSMDDLNEIERAFADRAVRRKEVFRVLSIAGIVIAAGLAVFYGWERLHDPTFALAPRLVLIVLILLNARQNLRQHKYAALLEKLTRS